jgi:hypothetical protein
MLSSPNGKYPLGEGFLTSEAVNTVAPELVTMAEALEELEAEEAGAGLREAQKG